MKRPWVMAGLALCALLLPPGEASAHGVSPAISGFYAGSLMVLAGPDDVLQWISLCAFAATQEPDRAGWAAETLVVGLLGGIALGSLGWIASFPGWVSGAELLTVGVLLSASLRVPFAVLSGLVATIGLLRGMHDALDTAARPDKLALAAGIGVTAYLLMVVGISFVVWLLPRIASIRTVVVRTFGSWIVAIALMLEAFAFVAR